MEKECLTPPQWRENCKKMHRIESKMYNRISWHKSYKIIGAEVDVNTKMGEKLKDEQLK